MEMSAKDISVIERSSNNKLGEDDQITVPLKSEQSHENRLRRTKNVCECFREYSANTSIHGIQYLGEPNRPVWERLFWIVVFIISIYTCSHMINKLWRKWNDTPVIVSFDERETEIWKIPFPAVTICPQTKSNPLSFKFEDVVNKPLDKWTERERRIGKALLNVCELAREFPDLPIMNDTETEVDIIEELEDISFQIGAQLTFKGDDRYMSSIITEEGICYNFNSLNLRDLYSDDCQIPLYDSMIPNTTWNREAGYGKGAGLETHPLRVIGPGIKLGLDILLPGFNLKSDSVCDLPADGYKVLIHAPDNVPMISSKYFNLPAKHHVVAAVKPNMMWTSDELQSYSPDKRQCFFHHERKLKYFKTYTQINCKLECLTDYSISLCDCVKFSMPRFNGTRICQNFHEIKCLEEVEERFLSAEVEHEYLKKSQAKEMKADCNCLPPCTTVAYNIETSQSNLDISNLVKAYTNGSEQEDFNMVSGTRLTVFFKEGSFLTSKRSELYGMSEFVANCGGLLGLFMGFSVLSFVEIFYFSVIRVITNYVRRKHRDWI